MSSLSFSEGGATISGKWLMAAGKGFFRVVISENGIAGAEKLTTDY